MKHFVIVSALCLLTLWSSNAEMDTTTSLAEEVEFLKEEMKELRKENVNLREEMSRVQSGRYAAGEVFDCSASSGTTESGTLVYSSCSVDTTIDSSLLSDGAFRISQEGIYRLSFTGTYYIPSLEDADGSQPLALTRFLIANCLQPGSCTPGATYLMTNLFLNPMSSDTAGYYTISLETIQRLYPGEAIYVTLELGDGAYLSSGSTGNHFTGQFLGTY